MPSVPPLATAVPPAMMPKFAIVSNEPLASLRTPAFEAVIVPALVSVVVVLVPVEITPAPEPLSVMAPELVTSMLLPLP